ncbi:hypothetical protein HID58_080819, partial [Brassica napus]
SESLVLRLDHAVTTESQPDSPVSNFFKSLFKPFHGFFSLFPKPAKPTTTTIISPIIPSKILSRFDRIKNLDVERPGGDAKPEKSAGIKWKADFGKTLKTCVVVAFRSASTVSSSSDGELDAEFVTGLKTRVERRRVISKSRSAWREKQRSVVPSVRMSMRLAPSLKLQSGICLESATLVIEYSDVGDDELATEAFAGSCMYGEAVAALLK